MAANFKILGTTDSVTECECCGKKGLKKTIALASLDADGNDTGMVHYGVDCAARALLGSKTSGNRKVVETRASAIAYARKLVDRGHTLAVAAKAVWNRFGYLAEVRGETILIGGFGSVEF